MQGEIYNNNGGEYRTGTIKDIRCKLRKKESEKIKVAQSVRKWETSSSWSRTSGLLHRAVIFGKFKLFSTNFIANRRLSPWTLFETRIWVGHFCSSWEIRSSWFYVKKIWKILLKVQKQMSFAIKLNIQDVFSDWRKHLLKSKVEKKSQTAISEMWVR